MKEHIINQDICKVIVDNLNLNIRASDLVQCTESWSQHRYLSPNSCIGYVIEGKGWFKQDEEYITPQRGQMYLLTEKHHHSFGVMEGQPYKKYYCNFYEQNNPFDFWTICDLPLCITPRHPSYVQELFEKLIEKGNTDTWVSLLEQKTILYQLICEYIYSCQEHSQLNITGIGQSDILRSVEYIHTHFYENITNEKLAHIAGYNREYFVRKFNDVMECSPMKYLNDLRIRHAEELLKTTELSIREISERIGFETQHYFSYAFKKVHGFTPLVYRKMYTQTKVTIS